MGQLASPEPGSGPDQDERGQGFPQIIHDRARRAAEELHRLLLSLSTGTVVVYFLALTGRTEPPLTPAQRLAGMTGLVAMVIAALSGIVSSYSDIRRNYYWASALQAEQKAARSQLYRSRDRWLWIERASAEFLLAFFALGMVASGVYIVLRISGR